MKACFERVDFAEGNGPGVDDAIVVKIDRRGNFLVIKIEFHDAIVGGLGETDTEAIVGFCRGRGR